MTARPDEAALAATRETASSSLLLRLPLALHCFQALMQFLIEFIGSVLVVARADIQHIGCILVCIIVEKYLHFARSSIMVDMLESNVI